MPVTIQGRPVGLVPVNPVKISGPTGPTGATGVTGPTGPAGGISATIITAKLTTGGATGSMTFTNGLLTAHTDAT